MQLDTISNQDDCNINSEQFGVFIGRCQPFHLGHQAIINEIMLSGRTPIIVLGSIDKHDDKNPLTFDERCRLIRMVYPSIIIYGISDDSDWKNWFNVLSKYLYGKYTDRNKEDITIFYHNKECDKCSFIYDNHEFKNTFYTDVFKYEGLKTQEIEFVDRKDFKIESNGRDIRHNIDGFKHFLDARVYWALIRKGWK